MLMDLVDRRLLRAVQQDGAVTAQELGRRLGLSTSQAGRRRARLEQVGILRSIRAEIAPEACGLAMQAFLKVELNPCSAALREDFASLLQSTPEIVSGFALTGEADHLLRVWCADLAALNDLIQNLLLAHPAVARVTSQIVMTQIKPDTPLPL